VKTQLIKEALIRLKLVVRANVSCVILYIHFQIWSNCTPNKCVSEPKVYSARSL